VLGQARAKDKCSYARSYSAVNAVTDSGPYSGTDSCYIGTYSGTDIGTYSGTDSGAYSGTDSCYIGTYSGTDIGTYSGCAYASSNFGRYRLRSFPYAE